MATFKVFACKLGTVEQSPFHSSFPLTKKLYHLSFIVFIFRNDILFADTSGSKLLSKSNVVAKTSDLSENPFVGSQGMAFFYPDGIKKVV